MHACARVYVCTQVCVHAHGHVHTRGQRSTSGAISQELSTLCFEAVSLTGKK